MANEAYATFRHEAVCPLVQIGPNRFVLELFHGPTLAFKDVAMQLLARLIDHALAERGQRATIVGATSGDTGGAAIEAFANRDRSDIFILFPEGRVSPVQQHQMTTSGASAFPARGSARSMPSISNAHVFILLFPTKTLPQRARGDKRFIGRLSAAATAKWNRWRRRRGSTGSK